MMDSDQLTRQARAALKTGDKQKARVLSQQALRVDPQNHMAWMTLAVATPSPQAAMDYVQRAYRLQPDDPNVQKGLVWAKRRLAAQPPSPPLVPIATHEKKRKPLPLILLTIIILLGVSVIAYVGWSQFGGDGDVVAAIAVGTVEKTAVSPPITTPIPLSPNPQPIIAPDSTPHPIQPKNIAANSKQDTWATWTTTPTPTQTPTPSPTWQATFRAPQEGDLAERPLNIGRTEKWIDVNLSTQTLIAYEGDTVVYETLISSGLTEFATVTGQFRVWLRFESQTMDGRRLGYDYYLEDVPYVMYFFEDYALHGTFWHNNFGNPMSHGCVNMETGDAGWVFNWSEMGTVVNVHY